MRAEIAIAGAFCAALVPATAAADGADEANYAERVSDSSPMASPAEKASIELRGVFRSRAESLYNFDLDRGLSPSGQPLFPVPIGDASAQALSGINMRLRTDLRVQSAGSGLAAVVRTDILDNLSFGSTPNLRDGTPAASTGQDAPIDAFRLKRAYGEAALPFGVLTIGRQGNHWGLGMVANGGDCEDCDSSDSADRIAFFTPLFHHVFAIAYDIAATGPQAADRSSSRFIDLEPSDDAKNFTVAVLRYRGDHDRKRRARAGLYSFEYGAYLSHRWQDNDVPADYLGGGVSGDLRGEDLMHRGFSATASDVWLRLSGPRGRIEFEAALLRAKVEQSSLIPGVEFYVPATSTQIGAALESELYLGALTLGLDAGFASGDPSPGFGAFFDPSQGPAQEGDLDGSQANLPFDTKIDNFRFHSDYRVDRILFREIIGTVTDAYYLRPHMHWPLARSSGATLSLEAAAIASAAVQASSTPSGQAPLGVEFDPSLRYQTREGMVLSFDYALLVPLAAFDNPEMGLEAKPAQLARFRVRLPF